MEIRPILASLRRHRIPALLIVLEIALACAVLCNAVFMISQRMHAMHLPNAIDEHGLSIVSLNGADSKAAANNIPRDLDALRGIAGVKAVSVASSVSLSRDNWDWMFSPTPGGALMGKNNINLCLYFIGQGTERALGLHLLQGRLFSDEDMAGSSLGNAALPDTHVVILTRSAAEHLWPGKSALGKTLYTKGYSYRVVGVVADVLRPYITLNDGPRAYFSAFFPLRSEGVLDTYVIRSAPQDRDRVLSEATRKLSELHPDAVAKGRTFADIRHTFFADMSSMVWMLVLVCAVMVAVTAFGIVGLTSFWVGQRRRQIGIRRAVGASHRHILHYFQTENFLLTSLGVMLGMALAYGINLYLMKHYEMARMPWLYLPASAVALWLIGQLAVLGPALRASRVPPVVATRAA